MASGRLSDEVEQRKDCPLTEGGEIMLENKIKTYTNSLKEIQQEIDNTIKDEETNPLHKITDRTVRQLQAKSLSNEVRNRLDIYIDTSNLFCSVLKYCAITKGRYRKTQCVTYGRCLVYRLWWVTLLRENSIHTLTYRKMLKKIWTLKSRYRTVLLLNQYYTLKSLYRKIQNQKLSMNWNWQ